MAVAAALAGRELSRMMRRHPELFPWTELSLRDPVGPFTALKLASLGDERERCIALLQSAGLEVTPFEQPPSLETRCKVDDGVLLDKKKRSIAYAPGGLVTSCPVAASLLLWERHTLQPASQRHFGSQVVRIDHAGSFSCRRVYGRDEGRFSEHATADAIDITGFRLADGRAISVLRDWDKSSAESRFLRESREGACELFSTVLSPEYNRAHSDHFHLDQAARGSSGWRLCS